MLCSRDGSVTQRPQRQQPTRPGDNQPHPGCVQHKGPGPQRLTWGHTLASHWPNLCPWRPAPVSATSLPGGGCVPTGKAQRCAPCSPGDRPRSVKSVLYPVPFAGRNRALEHAAGSPQDRGQLSARPRTRRGAGCPPGMGTAEQGTREMRRQAETSNVPPGEGSAGPLVGLGCDLGDQAACAGPRQRAGSCLDVGRGDRENERREGAWASAGGASCSLTHPSVFPYARGGRVLHFEQRR